MNKPKFLLWRPRLKRGRIAHHSSKVTIMQPIQNRFFLAYTGELEFGVSTVEDILGALFGG